MDFATWKAGLINEIETAASWRAEEVRENSDDPRIEKGQKALFELAEAVKALPDDHDGLKRLHNEEVELDKLMRAVPGEPESRYHDAKEELLRGYGVSHEIYPDADAFLQALRDRVDHTISEYRWRQTQTASTT